MDFFWCKFLLTESGGHSLSSIEFYPPQSISNFFNPRQIGGTGSTTGSSPALKPDTGAKRHGRRARLTVDGGDIA
jgi:hypothetical protein